MTVILHECLEFVIIYVDDVIVFSASVEDHIIHLNQVIRSLNNVNLRLRLEKCEIGMQKLLILGHVVTGHSISPDPFKLSTLLTLPAPRTGKQLESFLGFTNYLRSFVPLYAQIAAPLEKHRKVKELGPVWSVECDISFNKLKEVLSCHLVLPCSCQPIPTNHCLLLLTLRCMQLVRFCTRKRAKVCNTCRLPPSRCRPLRSTTQPQNESFLQSFLR